MFNVVCRNLTGDHSPDAVNVLYDMCRRNLPEGTEGRFICLIGNGFAYHGYDDGIEVQHHLDALPETYLELPINCCIIGALEGEITYADYDPSGLFPTDATVVLFHDKRPAECDGWVKHIWKIGGATMPAKVTDTNISVDDRRVNVISALERDCRWFEPVEATSKAMIIVGGGPSLNDELLTLQAIDGDIFAVNNAARYLDDRGIRVQAHVLMDAHGLVADFVAPDIRMDRYYASQCEPGVLDMAGKELICWHAASDCLNSLSASYVVSGGSTAAMRALILGYGLGYRMFHLFGIDCSFSGEKQHIYLQHKYPDVVDVACGERSFKSSPQMVAQAEDFKVTAWDMIQAGCEITVHGNSLLKAVAEEMILESAKTQMENQCLIQV